MRVMHSWVYAQTRRDELPHLRLGRYVRYRRSAIESWMGKRGYGTGQLYIDFRPSEHEVEMVNRAFAEDIGA